MSSKVKQQQDLIPMEDQAVEVQRPQETNFLAVIARAASDPNVDVQKMGVLLDMQFKIQAKQAEMAFTQAMARLQPRLPRIPKRGQIVISKGAGSSPMSRYMLFEDIDKVVRPLLAEEGFAVTFGIGDPVENRISVTCTIRHCDGHSVSNTLPLPLDTSGAKGNVQGVGSTVTYGKRYLLCMMLNIVAEGEDNDGADIKTIDQTQLNKLLDLIQIASVPEGKICQHYKVSRLEDIRQEQFPEAINLLNQRIAAQKKA